MKKYIVEYSHNNSSGIDWVTQEQFQELIKKGWKVPREYEYKEGDWIYSVQKEIKAYSSKGALDVAIDEWSNVTNQNEYDEGCECCGPPHSFYVNEKDKE